MKKILQIFAILTIFISNNLIAEENLLTIKQQLDRLQRDVNDLSKSFYNNPAQQIQNSEQNNNIQSINFAAIDIRIYDLEKDIKNLTMNIEEILFQLDEINTKISEVEENFINRNKKLLTIILSSILILILIFFLFLKLKKKKRFEISEKFNKVTTNYKSNKNNIIVKDELTKLILSKDKTGRPDA